MKILVMRRRRIHRVDAVVDAYIERRPSRCGCWTTSLSGKRHQVNKAAPFIVRKGYQRQESAREALFKK